MLICKCAGVEAEQIEQSIRAHGLRTREEVTQYTRAGGGCTSCHADIAALLEGRAPVGMVPDPVPAPVAASSDPRWPVIAETIEKARPRILRDGGDIQLVAVDGDFVRVRLTGTCTHCALAGQTLGSLRRELMAVLGTPVRVVPAAS